MTTPRPVDHLPPKLDVMQASVAYGMRAIPKLKRELAGEDVLVIQQGLRSLGELLRNPQYITEAIHEGIIDECKRLSAHSDYVIRLLTLQLLVYVASHAVGRSALLEKGYIQTLTERFEDEEALVRELTHETMGLMASQMPCAAAIIEAQLPPTLVSRIVEEEDPQIKVKVLSTVRHCLKCNADPFLKTKLMPVIVDLLSHESCEVRAGAGLVLTELSFPLEGKRQSVKYGAVPAAIKLLGDEDEDVRANAASAIMTMCITTEAKEEAEKHGIIDALPPLLDDTSRRVVLLGVKAIATVAALPTARKAFLPLVPKLEELKVPQPNALDKDVLIRAAQHAISTIQWLP